MHVLDNPVWHALTGPHATVAQRLPLAARYPTDVSVFGAVPDEATPKAWSDLAALVGPGGVTALVRRELSLPAGWSTVFTLPCRQMLLPDDVAVTTSDAPTSDAPTSDAPTSDAPNADEPLLPLRESDVPEMLALVERTQPGPLLARTIELGTYLGIRDGDALVAMAGERMHPTGFTEISAVCTESSHRGRGLASRLVRAMVAGIRARGEIPILHLTTANEPAYRIYSELGFETRMLFDVAGVKGPS